jgi:hypothetical protein
MTSINGSALPRRFDFYAAMVTARIFTGAAKDVAYFLLFRHMNGTTGRCDPAITRLAEETGLNERSVRRAICELEESGWWYVGHGEGTVGNGGRTNTYRPNFGVVPHRTPPEGEGGDSAVPTFSPKVGTHRSLPFDEGGDPRVRKVGTHRSSEPIKNQEEDFNAEFVKVWPDIPKRPGEPKEPAHREFVQARLEGAPFEAMMRGWAINKQYLERHPEQGQYIASVARWIREKRWEDWQELPAEASPRLRVGSW